MAQKIEMLLLDDLDGSPAQETVRFSLDGTEYGIDLNTGHAQALRAALARYIDAARRDSGTRPPARSRKPGPGSPDNAAVRDWARNQGIEVNARGRIPAGLVVKFQAAAEE